MQNMSMSDIQKELGRLKQLEAALLHEARGMSNTDKIRALEAAQPMVKPKTRQMAALLEAGYHMSLEEAQAILTERKADPQAYPYAEYKKAQAFIAAYEAKPVVTSTRAGWRRTRGV